MAGDVEDLCDIPVLEEKKVGGGKAEREISYSCVYWKESSHRKCILQVSQS